MADKFKAPDCKVKRWSPHAVEQNQRDAVRHIAKDHKGAIPPRPRKEERKGKFS